MKIKDLFVIARYNYDSVTISAGSYLSITSTGSNIPDGYNPVAICQYSTTNNNAIPRTINSGDGSIYIKNVASTDITITPLLKVLCVKSDFIGA